MRVRRLAACFVVSIMLLANCAAGGQTAWVCTDIRPEDRLDESRLAAPHQNNLWYRNDPNADTVIVFVHGIFSDSRSCWLHDAKDAAQRRYWPQLIENDPVFAHSSIFLGGYYTAVDAAAYDVRHAVNDELLPALRDRQSGQRSVLDHQRIVFVCHSTGGIVARYLLQQHWPEFKDKSVALLLIASPSLGSERANTAEPMIRLYGNKLASQLRVNSELLTELDANFKDLLEDGRIPELFGREAFENHFIIHRKWFPDLDLVVNEASAGRYFRAATLLRGTDHFSAVKPDCRDHPGYLFVRRSLEQFMAKYPRKSPVPTGQPRGKTVLRVAMFLNGAVFYTREVMAAISEQLDAALQNTPYVASYEYAVGRPESTKEVENAKILDELLRKFDQRADYLIPIGTAVSEVAYKRYAGKIPIVFAAVTDPIRSGLVKTLKPDPTREAIAGVLYGVPTATYLEFLQRTFPNKTFGYLAHSAFPQDIAFWEQVQSEAGRFPRLHIVKIDVTRPAVPQKQATGIDIFFGRYYFMANLAAFTRSTSKPFVAADLSNVKKGAVASFATDAREIGERAVSEIIVPNLLRGEALSSIPIITPTRAKIGINLSAARRFGVSIPQSAVQEADLVIP